MLSIVVYGRNDSHGFNLHKRVSLSLNSFAENLNLEHDEIIFVDWNSETNIGTLPEMIEDTLTEKCKRLLKIVVVPPAIHESLVPKNHSRPVIESIARNVGIFRTNSANRWLLCTNTDILISNALQKTLSEQVVDLSDGFYQAFRYEIPEYIWSGFNRMDPKSAVEDFESFGGIFDGKVSRDFFGNITPDAPGDFQLADRSAWFECGAFPETMLLGSHVDSILALKMASIRDVSILHDNLRIYHCNHLRQLTHLHNLSIQKDIFNPDAAKNNFQLDREAKWGLPDLPLRTFSLGESFDLEKRSLVKPFLASQGNLFRSVGFQIPSVTDGVLDSPASRIALWLLESIQTKSNQKIFYIGKDLELELALKFLFENNVQLVEDEESLKISFNRILKQVHLIFDFRFSSKLFWSENFMFIGLQEWLNRADTPIPKILVSAIGLEYPKDLEFARQFQSRTGDAYTQIQTGHFNLEKPKSFKIRPSKFRRIF